MTTKRKNGERRKVPRRSIDFLVEEDGTHAEGFHRGVAYMKRVLASKSTWGAITLALEWKREGHEEWERHRR